MEIWGCCNKIGECLEFVLVSLINLKYMFSLYVNLVSFFEAM